MLKYINGAVMVLFLVVIFSPVFAFEKLPVFVSIVPQKFFVQQIGKKFVNVEVMVQPGASPAIYEPKPRQMASLSKAKLYFAIGVPFEQTWLKKIGESSPNMQIVHTDAGIKKRPMHSVHFHEQSQHGSPGKEHHHADDESLDPHIWLSPPLVKVQAEIITTALSKADPEHQHIYQANYRDFLAQIDRLDDQLKQVFREKKGLSFLVFHPSWGYFAHTYGLTQVPIEIEGKTPKPSLLKQIIKQARKNKINIIFVQPQFSSKSAKLVAKEINGQIITADPLALDWMNNMQKMAQKFKEALR